MKVVIPVAGVGSRLKPHTFSTPKPLMDVAGKAILSYIVDEILKLNPTEVIFVVGHLKSSIENYISKNYPDMNSVFVNQTIADGDGSAIRLALNHTSEDDDVLVVFGDTLIDFDIKNAIELNQKSDCLVFVMKVENPEHYGVVNLDLKGTIINTEEKPENPKSDLAIIGAYYFKSSFVLRDYLNYFYDKKITVKGEFKLIQAIQEYIAKGTFEVYASKVKKWFDCGRVSVLLEANNYFLEKSSKGKIVMRDTSIIIPPCFVHKSAQLENCVIGPHVSIGENCHLKDVAVKRSIINQGASIKNIVLSDSLIGKDASLRDKARRMNIGEKSEVYLE
ncbi:MAG: sugar phosphate nucleotidyltransferase [Candidatus Woesearchaeota archaeon]|jgi:glucose-1-phosphate thymidylyltransferase|nr:sugar phosphate nucleotidyltransferase [Candidatus Woesearchaeota archaeon]